MAGTPIVDSTGLVGVFFGSDKFHRFKFFRCLEKVFVVSNYFIFDIFEVGFLGQNDGIDFLGSSLLDFSRDVLVRGVPS